MSQVIRVFFQIHLGFPSELGGGERSNFMNNSAKNHDGHLVYCAYIKRNGKIIYPKNAKVFKFWVKGK